MVKMMLITVLLAFLACCLSQSTMPWMNKSLSPADRAKALLSAMTTEEKIAMLHGIADEPDVAPEGYVGYVVGNDRFGIPPLKLNDGPQGFRVDEYPGTSTCWPSLMTVG
jgi:beta-glucosidase